MFEQEPMRMLVWVPSGNGRISLKFTVVDYHTTDSGALRLHLEDGGDVFFSPHHYFWVEPEAEGVKREGEEALVKVKVD